MKFTLPIPQLGWSDHSAYGHPTSPTPNIQQMVDEGLLFAQSCLQPIKVSCSNKMHNVLTRMSEVPEGPVDDCLFIHAYKAFWLWVWLFIFTCCSNTCIHVCTLTSTNCCCPHLNTCKARSTKCFGDQTQSGHHRQVIKENGVLVYKQLPVNVVSCIHVLEQHVKIKSQTQSQNAL